MKIRRLLMVVMIIALAQSCTHAIPRFGLAGRYLEGRDQFLRGKGGNMDLAVNALESVVKEDPLYKDSLTLLGRAYYRTERLPLAYEFLQRALAINKDDEIAWLILGQIQLRSNENEKALATLQGGITLLSKVAVRGYRGFADWDARNFIRGSINRCAFTIAKGIDSKQEILSRIEALLNQIDDEENAQQTIMKIRNPARNMG